MVKAVLEAEPFVSTLVFVLPLLSPSLTAVTDACKSALRSMAGFVVLPETQPPGSLPNRSCFRMLLLALDVGYVLNLAKVACEGAAANCPYVNDFDECDENGGEAGGCKSLLRVLFLLDSEDDAVSASASEVAVLKFGCKFSMASATDAEDDRL